MRLLKYLLVIILSALIAWGGAIFFGPTLIRLALESVAPGAVKVERLQVSPKLEVTASRIEWELTSNQDVGRATALVRGLRVNWEYNDNFVLALTLGPSQIPGVATLAGATARLAPVSLFDWSHADLIMNFGELSAPQLSVRDGKMTGDVVGVLRGLENIRFSVNGVAVNMPQTQVEAPVLEVELDQYDLARPALEQVLQYTANFPGGITADGIEAGSLRVDGRLADFATSFSVAAGALKIAEGGVSVETIGASTQYDLRTGVIGPEVEVSAANIVSSLPKASVTSYEGVTTLTGAGEIRNTSRVLVSQAEIALNDFFVGELRDGTFSIKLGTVPNGASGTSRIDVEVDYVSSKGLEATLNLDAAVATANLMSCTETSCGFGDVSAAYTVNADGERLEGRALCSSAVCKPSDYQHSIATKNTGQFFQNLARVGGINPLLLSLMFSEMRRGLVSGDGHIIEF